MVSENSTEGSPANIPTDFKTGSALLLSQTKVLFKKNVLVYIRNRQAAITQTLAPLLMILLIFMINEAIKADARRQDRFRNVYEPQRHPAKHIPNCDEMWHRNLKQPCHDFLYWPNTIEVKKVVDNIRNNNVPKIAESKVKGFADAKIMEKHLFDNPNTVMGAYYFQLIPDKCSFSAPKSAANRCKKVHFELAVNSTVKSKRGQFEDPNFAQQLPLQNAAERELSRLVLGDEAIEWEYNMLEFPHPAFQEQDIIGVIAPIFLYGALMFGFVIQIRDVVEERENKLRQALTVIGMRDTAFWLSWVAWELILAFVAALICCVAGAIFQFDVFTKHNWGVLFILFWLFTSALAALAFCLSTVLQKSANATATGIGIFIFGFVTMIAGATAVYVADPAKVSKILQVIFAFMPWCLWQRALVELSNEAAKDNGMEYEFSDLSQIGTSEWPVSKMMHWLLFDFFFYMILAIYLDKVQPLSRGGQGESLIFFLKPNFWLGKSVRVHTSDDEYAKHFEAAEDADVCKVEEDTKALKASQDTASEQQYSVMVWGLHRHFGPKNKAVRGNWFTIPKQQLFCLLGPNGAGKSTTINCLTGILPVSLGDAEYMIDGQPQSIRDPVSMQNIRASMGVCPQFDTTWDALTGREHLEMFATVKGCLPDAVKYWSDHLLRRVDLVRDVQKDSKEVDPSSQRSGAYSGGMRRRLSVAIAMIGNPRVVYLDEPTTGMDPISRRKVWDTIVAFKEDRAIVLTTHSMEEADILGDMISIICKGRLRCIGTAIHLKETKGAGYRISVGVAVERNSTAAEQAETRRLKQLVGQFFSDRNLSASSSEEIDDGGTYITFVIPQARKSEMPELLERLVEYKVDGIKVVADVNLGMTTLEDVFLAIAKHAEATSVQHDSVTTLTFEGVEYLVHQNPANAYHLIAGSGNENQTGPLPKDQLPPKVARLYANGADVPSPDGPVTFVQLKWEQDAETGKNLVQSAKRVSFNLPDVLYCKANQISAPQAGFCGCFSCCKKA